MFSRFISQLEMDQRNRRLVHFELYAYIFGEANGSFLETEEGLLSLTE